ncbi:MAG: hypothetical protein GY822_21000 [Deltaproteobacteria bacterium]|nr:hypothetical protein [Deltaproteobacteria bacterium]
MIALSTTGCRGIEYESDWTDHPDTQDPSIDDDLWLVSQRYPNPAEEEKDLPVLVSLHGFSASTYTFLDKQERMEEQGVLFSNILLGGHGRSTDAAQTQHRRSTDAAQTQHRRLARNDVS